MVKDASNPSSRFVELLTKRLQKSGPVARSLGSAAVGFKFKGDMDIYI